MGHMFRDFLFFEGEYRRAETFWRELVARVAHENGQAGDWSSWLTQVFGNGARFPVSDLSICDARSQKLGRALRIQAAPPLGERVEIGAWVHEYDLPIEGAPWLSAELHVHVVASEEAVSVVRALVDLWMRKSTTVSEMNEGIGLALDGVGAPRDDEVSGEVGASAHVSRLYEDFLVDEGQYRCSEDLWRELVMEAAELYGGRSDWKPWLPAEYWDGSPRVPEGNPMFDVRSERLGRALRIIQHAAMQPTVEVDAWISPFDYSEYGAGRGEELSVSCALSEEAVKVVRRLVQQWMDPATPIQAVRRAITAENFLSA